MTGRVSTPTVIIGAGPSGLAVAACLKKRGLGYTLLDAADRVGDAWHRHYERLHLHTARALSSLPHLPMPASWPTYPSRAQVASYLQTYSDALGLEPRLGVRVARAERQAGAWLVDCVGGPDYRADSLVVATGYNAVPSLASWPGLDTFPGEVLHSSRYKNGKHLSGQRVLVIGSGNSGAEIAIDLWEHGAQPAMSIRGPVHVVPRDLLGVPAQRVTVALSHLPARVADRLSQPLRQTLIGDLRPWGIQRPDVGPLELLETKGRVPLIDVGTVALIKQGSIKVYPDVRAVAGKSVELVDGRKVEVDAIVMATGYKSGLERWLVGADAVLDARGLPRLHGKESALGRLWFCGFRNPTTGALRESGIEAQRIAKALAHVQPAVA
ncbi:MAG: NAD(P)/FAD-dependent oxidoreductase [Myxococcota bacterium]